MKLNDEKTTKRKRNPFSVEGNTPRSYIAVNTIHARTHTHVVQKQVLSVCNRDSSLTLFSIVFVFESIPENYTRAPFYRKPPPPTPPPPASADSLITVNLINGEKSVLSLPERLLFSSLDHGQLRRKLTLLASNVYFYLFIYFTFFLFFFYVPATLKRLFEFKGRGKLRETGTVFRPRPRCFRTTNGRVLRGGVSPYESGNYFRDFFITRVVLILRGVYKHTAGRRPPPPTTTLSACLPCHPPSSHIFCTPLATR